MNKEIDLSKYGITGSTYVYNPSYDDLYKAETDPSLTGYEACDTTTLGAVNVMTGKYTGRSPKDKFFVKDSVSENTLWWNTSEYPNDNKPVSEKTWEELKKLAAKELSNKKLYVVDAFCGANAATRLKVRFVMEVAWQAHFVKNMFIRPTEEELKEFDEPDFLVLNASKASVENYAELGLNSPTAVVFSLKEKEQLIFNTWYGGEMKKGIFSIMNYINPLRGIASMHCSANTDLNGENTAVFFGLSGTGKTTLSTDPKRLLIGDDEHGWDDDGVFNYEGGCYAKVIHLDPASEPDIYHAIKRDALLENVIVVNHEPDFGDSSATQNTRVSYPIYHIEKIVRPVSKGPHAKSVIFLTADAYGVLPPVAMLTEEQMEYYFLSGYTSKVAGTEIGVKDPIPTFSACFGSPFLSLHPLQYASILLKRIRDAGARAYLVNTGWNGSGKRVSIKDTRAIIDGILNGSIEHVPTKNLPIFNLRIPVELKGTNPGVLDPRNTYTREEMWEERARKLSKLFRANFVKFEHNPACAKLKDFGPEEVQ